MLSSLLIENIAVIERAEILFDHGLNILTGETGAGKSIVIDAINAILGERTSRDIVRNGCERAKVTACFDNVSDRVISLLNDSDIDCDDRNVIITRIISSDGRGSCKVNGSPVTVSMLKDIGRNLITICGQHDSQFLLLKEHHLSFIDNIANTEEQLSDYKETFFKLKQANKELRMLLKNEDEKERRLEFLKYQIDELASAELKCGEKDTLIREKKKIQAKEKIVAALNGAQLLLNGDDMNRGISESVHGLIDCVDIVSEYDTKFSVFNDSLRDMLYSLEDLSSEISGKINNSDDSYSDIDSIEQRLDLLYRLSKKYGNTEEEMLEHLNNISQEYENLLSGEERCEKLYNEISLLEDELIAKATCLSDCRKKAAADFEINVKNELIYLDMPNAQFKVDFKEANAGENGFDEVEFLFSSNFGQEPKPLQKIASGGELSRVMLAIRCVLSDRDTLDTMIFDEIDTGVSGRAAHKIAYKMSNLSKNKQVLCVTHLAQIAAYADNHLYIEKNVYNGATFTEVVSLDDASRVREIARIIGGDVITENTVQSAKELISFANNEII